MLVKKTIGIPPPPVRSATRTYRSPWLGEVVVIITRGSRWKENHVVAIAKGHEFKTPKPDHRPNTEWTFGISHPERNGNWHAGPYLACQLSVSGLGGVLNRRV